ncbi:hypothetical protein [Spiroplasma endosymbiont of Notiophilus biguttatus]|uniref:hypothetical protein n=1 Tax=Spiroplasma endosymbiont of Notiophilus biguttatus TaxID=3066285 RepID=UPI00313D2A4A
MNTKKKQKKYDQNFKNEKNKLKELEKKASETRVNGFIAEEDNRQKSPVRTMKRMGF